MKKALQNIRKIRRSKDYNQSYMAMKLEISIRRYSAIENNHTKLSFEMATKIAAVLEVSLYSNLLYKLS